jgi:hypothetical protein
MLVAKIWFECQVETPNSRERPGSEYAIGGQTPRKAIS